MAAEFRSLITGLRVRFFPLRDVAVAAALLALINVLAHFTVDHTSTVLVPLGAVVALGYARWRGFTWRELGLARGQLRGGLRYAAVIVIPVVMVAIGGAMLPLTRSLFLNDEFSTTSAALWAALIVIPLQTVIPEEVLFRSVLNASLVRTLSVPFVYAVGATLFGMWHISSSLGLTAGNAGLTDLLGTGFVARLAGVIAAVSVTSAAGLLFIWLRRRSDSLLAPIALHWVLNGAGALSAALAWQLSS